MCGLNEAMPNNLQTAQPAASSPSRSPRSVLHCRGGCWNVEGVSTPSPSLRDRPRSVGTRPPRSSAGVPGWGTGLSPRSTAGGPGHSVKGPMAPHTYAARAIGAGCPPGLRTLPANQGERRRPGHPSMPRAHPPVRNHLYCLRVVGSTRTPLWVVPHPAFPLPQVLLWGCPNTPTPGVAQGLLRAERVGSPKGLWALAQIGGLKGARGPVLDGVLPPWSKPAR